MAATDKKVDRKGAAALIGVIASGTAGAATLPEDQAEAMFHVYDGGGVTATGPALWSAPMGWPTESERR